jgi:hypothetical protein
MIAAMKKTCDSKASTYSPLMISCDQETMVVNSSCHNLSSLLGTLFRTDCSHHVIFACTNDTEASKFHPDWLSAGVHVVTAKNSGLSGTIELRELWIVDVQSRIDSILLCAERLKLV